MTFIDPASQGGTNKVEQDQPDDNPSRMPQIPLDPLADPDADPKDREKSRRLAKYWLGQIDKVDDEQKKWVKRGKSIEKRYRDERNRVDEEGQRRMNNLWANVQILFPALYGKCPIPIAERRFHDKDQVGRAASQIIERALRNEIEINDFHDSTSSSVMDYLLPGRAVVWVRYEPEFGPSISIPVDSQNDLRDAEGDIEKEHEDEEGEEEEKLEETGSRILRESAPVDYINWLDFYMFPAKARKWKDVRAVGKRIYISRDEMKERFGDKIGKAIPLQSEDREKRNQSEQRRAEDELDAKGEVFEIWDKDMMCVYWVAKQYDFLLDRKDDPLQLENFYPVPRPLCANATNNTIIPVPDYAQYQDQAIMLDELTQRISQLSKACKIAGLYNAASEEISRLLDESVENELIPVDNWAAFAEKGGIAGQISLLPLKEIIGCIQELQAIKAQVVQEMDRLSGIPDIMRGTTDARETMGAQRLKTNNSGSRLGYRQSDVARFARDVVCLVAEVMCKHFSPKSLIEVSGALYEEGLGPDDVKALGFGDNADQTQQPMLMPPQMPQMPPQAPLPGPGGMPSGPTAATPAVPPPAGPGGAPSLMNGGGQQIQSPQPGQQPPSPMDDANKLMQALMRIKKAIDLLRDDHIRGFRIDIEIDSTIYGDQAQEKADRVEFIGAITKFLQEAGQMGSIMPQMTPLLGKLLQFGVRGFRVGRDLETSIEEFVEQVEVVAKQHLASPPPNPEAEKAKLEMGKLQMQGQQLQQKGQMEMAKTQAESQHLQQKSQMEAGKDQAEVQRQQVESQSEAFNSKIDLQSKQMDFEMRKMEMEIEKERMQLEREKMTHERGMIEAQAKLAKETKGPDVGKSLQ